MNIGDEDCCTEDGTVRYSFGIYAGRYCDKHWKESGFEALDSPAFDTDK